MLQSLYEADYPLPLEPKEESNKSGTDSEELDSYMGIGYTKDASIPIKRYAVPKADIVEEVDSNS